MGRVQVSKRLEAVRPSATVALTDRARAMVAAGRDIISLSAGEPDFDTPVGVRRAAAAAMEAGFTHYTPSAGIPELRRAIAAKLARENGVTVDPVRGVLVLPGVKQGLAYACLAFLDEGDECLCPEPGWVSYRELVTLAGGRHVSVPGRVEDGFRMRPEDFESRVTPRTKLIFLNTPVNPTGKVWSLEELEAVAETARRHDLVVIADEIYERILFEGHRHHSIASLPGMAERTLTLNGFSKVHAMTGWRLGYVAGPEHLVWPLMLLQQHTVTCAVSFVQKAAVAALEGEQTEQAEMLRAFERRRRLLAERLSDVPGLSFRQPQGTFYMWLDVRECGRSSAAVCEHLLERHALMLTPGDAFGDCGEGFVRLSFAAADEVLEAAAGRLRAGLAELVSSRG